MNLKKFVILLIAAFILIGFTPLLADEINFEDMTIEELKSVDISKLSKKEQKKLKSVLKKKEKAFKKAEKKRKADEKKRLAAEKKAEKKRASALKKKLKHYNWAYKNTSVVNDEFSASIEVRGPEYMNSGTGKAFAMLLTGVENTNYEEYFMRSYISGNKELHQVYITIRYIDRYRRYKDALFPGGVRGKFVHIDSEIITCGNADPNYCTREEEMAVTIPRNVLLNSFKTGNDLRIAFNSKSGHRHVQTVKADYIRGFVSKMNTAFNNIPEETMALVQQDLNTIK